MGKPKYQKPDWNSIKVEYINGGAPREIAQKYNIKTTQLYEYAYRYSWKQEKEEIEQKLVQDVKKRIGKVSSRIVDELYAIATNEMTRDADKIAACKALLDVSGLKSSKQEIINGGGEMLVRKVFVTKEETKQLEDHIDKVLNE